MKNVLNEDIEITLLSKEEVKGKSKVLQKVEADCGEYWTSTPLGLWAGEDYATQLYVSAFSKLSVFDFVNCVHGVRPVLKSNNLTELIRNCNSTIESDVPVIEYGNFPDFLNRALINDISSLQATGQVYSLLCPFSRDFNLARFEEYDDGKQKVVKHVFSYYPVKPIKWYVDEENGMLISKEVLFHAPININSQNDDISFEKTELYRYLNNDFLKQIFAFSSKSLTNNGSADQVKITFNDRTELKSRIENLLRHKQELLKQSEGLDNKSRNKRKVKSL